MNKSFRLLSTQIRCYATEVPSSQFKVPIEPPQPPLHLPISFAENQRLPLPTSIDPSLADELHEIVRHFRAPLRAAFAYGSGVYKQANYAANARPMLDFIFVVTHPAHWHDLNMHQHGQHYSLLSRLLGSNFTGMAQEKLGAGVWYNVDCLVGSRRIKYGVVSIDLLCRDLLDWETLYLAGRMQKPIYVLKEDARVRLANQVNLSSALRTALLLLPSHFTETELYETITSLSYRGDPRMSIAENPRKIQNIVSAQMEQFRRLYSPLLPSSSLLHQTSGSESDWEQDTSTKALADYARKLPLGLKSRIKAEYERRQRIQILNQQNKKADARIDPLEEKMVWNQLVQEPDFKVVLAKSLSQIVGSAAFTQSVKGALSVGVYKGISYLWPKLKKRFSK